MAASEVFERILALQERGRRGLPPFAVALAEIEGGRKRSCWSWYVFPTLKGVRRTTRPDLELPSFASARLFLRQELLASRLCAAVSAAEAHLRAGARPDTLFGLSAATDADKYAEACTVFGLAAQREGLSEQAALFTSGLAALGTPAAAAASARAAAVVAAEESERQGGGGVGE